MQRSNRDVIVRALADAQAAFPDAVIDDRTEQTAMIAVQGPEAVSKVAALLPFDPDTTPLFTVAQAPGPETLVARTGYTGEDGVELMVEAGVAMDTWARLQEAGVTPCGLVARDSLRLEAALRLYGNDMDTSVNPYEAGLGRFVDLTGGSFTGKEALARIKEHGPQRRLAGFVMDSRGIPRHGQTLLHEGEAVGEVTSGGRAPTLNQDIGMGFLPVPLARKGTAIAVDIRGRSVPAAVVGLPFYRRPRG